MEPKAQPSFIPREATQAARTRRTGSTGLLDFFTLISIVLLVASGALAAAVFLYHQYLESSAASKLNQLERASAAFEPALIQELTRLDDRMRAASDVLGRHLSIAEFFRVLEQTTIQTVAFRTLSLDAVDPQRMSIQMDGVAESVNAIALQADLFSQIGTITSPIFSNIDRREDGVHFSLRALLNPSALNYAALVRGFSQGPPQQVTQPPPAAEVSEEPASPFGNTPETTEAESATGNAPTNLLQNNTTQ